MPILILSRTRPSLHWERISVSHSIATAASPTAAKEPDKYRRLIGAMSAHGPFSDMRHAPKDFELRGVGVPTLNQTVSTLRFFFRVRLRRHEIVEHTHVIHEPRKLHVFDHALPQRA